MLRDLFKRTPDSLILLFFLSLILLQTIPSLQQKSVTFDEVMRQLPGYLSLTTAEYWYHPDKPPFIKMLAAAPLLFIDVKLPQFPQQWTDATRWQIAQDFLHKTNDADQLIFLGRLAMLPLSLLLGFFVFRWAKEIFGRPAAIFALFLYSFEPNILAHSRLMNTDLGIACFAFLTIYGFYHLLNQLCFSRLLLTGLVFGLSLVTKFSSLLFIPTLLLLGVTVALSKHPITLQFPKGRHAEIKDRGKKLMLVLAVLVAIGLIGYWTIWAFYQFRFEAKVSSAQIYSWVWNQPGPNDPLVKQSFRWANELKLLPEAYLFGLYRIIEGPGREAFLMGKVSDGWWYYFFVTFVLKTPLAFLVIIALALSLVPKLWRDHTMILTFLIVPVIVYFGIASASRLNIGHRHLLPIYPFLFVLAGNLIPWSKTQKSFVKILLAGLAVWYLISSVPNPSWSLRGTCSRF